MRVLVTSTPGTGHIHPLVPLATELRAAGHEVVWATAADSCPKVEAYGFRAVRAGMTGEARARLFFAQDRGLAALPERERRKVFLPVLFGEIAAPRMRDDLVGIVEDLRPDVVLHDLVELATPPIATARGIPHVTVAFGATLSSALLEATAASVVVSHAGSGTMFAAAERGLPQLCVPVKADQWDNADALASTGAGLTLEPGDRDARTIHEALIQLLDGTAHRDAARTLAREFAALPHPREHVAEIESLR